MPGPYTPAKLGPWTGGINTLSDPSAIPDNQLADCVNMELDLDGSYIVRPPVTNSPGPVAWLGTDILLLGYFTFPTGSYLLGSNATGTYYKLGGAPWVLIAANLKSTSAVQYAGKVFIVAANESVQGSGSWNPSAGYTAIPTMPRGQTITVFKDRGFICAGETAAVNESRLWLSKVTDLTDWTTAQLTAQIDINPGDGQSLVDIIVYNNTLVCFKQNSTYVYSYNVSPSDGAVRPISITIGVPTHHCVVSFENNLFLFHNNRIYQVLKFNFGCINLTVPFKYDATSPGTFTHPIFVTLHGTRLLVRYYHRVYAFGLRTRTWTRWESNQYFGPFVLEPINAVLSVNPRFFAGSCINNDSNVYQSNDGYDSTSQEIMTCTILTKNHDMSHQIRVGRYFLTQTEKIKRLYYWTANVQTSNVVKGTVTPIVRQPQISWGALAAYTWGDLNTWGNLLTSPIVVSASIQPDDSSFAQMIRFPKALRFRQINFRLDIESDGTLDDGPDRIFQMTAMISSNAFAAEQVS